MRKQFIEIDNDGNSLCRRKRAEELTPWASELVEAEGGFWAFENIEDAEIWKKQI